MEGSSVAKSKRRASMMRSSTRSYGGRARGRVEQEDGPRYVSNGADRVGVPVEGTFGRGCGRFSHDDEPESSLRVKRKPET